MEADLIVPSNILMSHLVSKSLKTITCFTIDKADTGMSWQVPNKITESESIDKSELCLIGRLAHRVIL